MKNKITYQISCKVSIDNKYVGDIQQINPNPKISNSKITFQYFPKGHKIGGFSYNTLESCQKSLEFNNE